MTAVSELTLIDSEDLPMAALVAKHNALADRLGVKTVKKFENRTIALKRVRKLEETFKAQVAVAAEEAVVEEAVIDAEPVTELPAIKPTVEVAEPVAEVASPDIKPERKKRQKVFHYPPQEAIKHLKAGTLRAEARDMLAGGATLGSIEQLVADWDVRQGKTPHRLEPRAYGLVRLLHTYVGYALREEGEGDDKIIYVMDHVAWKEWKASLKSFA